VFRCVWCGSLSLVAMVEDSLPEAPDSAAIPPKRVHWARAAFRRAQLLYARWTFFLACAVLAFGGFIKLTRELSSGELDAFDRAALEQVVAMRDPGLNGPAVDVTALGSVTVVTLLCVISTLVLLLQRDRLGAWQLVLAACGGGLLSNVMKAALERARPSHVEKLVAVSSFSYPSGHSLAAASVYLTLAIVGARHMPSRAGRIFLVSTAVLLMTCIGLSRAYLGVHYPSDIAAGLMLGAGWSLLVSSLFSYVRAQSA
jgi:undecaprenyl-diphosphatase